jgi:hypothetical protein
VGTHVRHIVVSNVSLLEALATWVKFQFNHRNRQNVLIATIKKIATIFSLLFVREWVIMRFFFYWLYSLCWALASTPVPSRFFTQTVGLLGRVISPSQGRYLYTGQHKHRINAYTDINALSGIRTHDRSVRASEDSSCLRLRGHYDRQ